MTPLRMRAASILAAAGLAGCDATPREPADPPVRADAGPASRPPQDPKSTVAKPDPVLIDYDLETRTLTLYDLPDRGGRWMLATPADAKGGPVNAVHRFIDEVDVDAVAVFYTTAAGHPSPRVRLREVLLARQQVKAILK